jgi:hypothetical protein
VVDDAKKTERTTTTKFWLVGRFSGEEFLQITAGDGTDTKKKDLSTSVSLASKLLSNCSVYFEVWNKVILQCNALLIKTC